MCLDKNNLTIYDGIYFQYAALLNHSDMNRNGFGPCLSKTSARQKNNLFLSTHLLGD